MSYEYHNEKLCDHCESRPKKWLLPFLYLDRNDRTHPNLGNDYHQYAVCTPCKEKQERILNAQGKQDWNKMWRKI